MYTLSALLALYLSAVAAVSAYSGRIVGGTATTLNTYPSIASILHLQRGLWSHTCGGTILSYSAVITAAHCVANDRALDVRMRVGSHWSTFGGNIHDVSRIIIHPSYNRYTRDNDAAILRTTSVLIFGTSIVSAAQYASQTYNLPDNLIVWAVGWGSMYSGGPNVLTLHHVQVWTINSEVCRQRYALLRLVTENMLCSGWLDVGGRGQCNGDSGGPLFHNGTLVGISSWGYGCGLPRFPGVNARVSRFAEWIGYNI